MVQSATIQLAGSVDDANLDLLRGLNIMSRVMALCPQLLILHQYLLEQQLPLPNS